MLSPIQSMVRPSRELAAQAGIEPGAAFLPACVSAPASALADLREVIAASPSLSTELRPAYLAVTRAAKRIHDNS
jgi:hypothetical protein